MRKTSMTNNEHEQDVGFRMIQARRGLGIGMRTKVRRSIRMLS